MAKTLLTLEEAVAMLQTVGASKAVVRAFQDRATFALQHKARGNAPDDPTDRITVNSGYGQKGPHVELTLNDALTQMEPKKATEIALMLLQAAEAAISDGLVMQLLERAGMSREQCGRVLLDMRELRHGTRGVSWPS